MTVDGAAPTPHQPPYLSRMSFLTDFTPPTPSATRTAWYIWAWEFTKPLNCTTALKVSTLMSPEFKPDDLSIAVFTFAVIAVSSTYSPVPSRVAVAAQPRTVVNSTALKRAEKRLNFSMIETLHVIQQ